MLTSHVGFHAGFSRSDYGFMFCPTVLMCMLFFYFVADGICCDCSTCWCTNTQENAILNDDESESRQDWVQCSLE